MSRKSTADWNFKNRMLSEKQINEIVTLGENEHMIFDIDDFGDRTANEFRVSLLNYMRMVKRVKIATRIFENEVYVKLTEGSKSEPLVEKPVENKNYKLNKAGEQVDDNGNLILATPEEMEAVRIKHEKQMRGE